MVQNKKNTYIVANDTGYSYLKTFINNTYDYVPTTIATLTSPSSYPDVQAFSDYDEKARDKYFDNIINHQYVSFSDESFPELSNYRYLIGNNAYDKGEDTQTIDYHSLRGKAGQQNTYAFILSAIAYKRVQDEYAKFKDDFELDKPLTANVEMMLTALPVSESKTTEDVERFKNNFTKNTHTVTLWNFKDGHIQVNIKFKQVEVTREGLIARLALYNAETRFPKMLSHIQEQLDKDYPDKHYDAEKLLQSPDVLIIDNGGGTGDMVKIIGNIVLKESKSIKEGYNTVYDRVAKIYSDNGVDAFDNSHEVEKFINDTENEKDPTTKAVLAEMKKYITSEANGLVERILRTFRSLMSGDASVKIKAIIVFGGGSTALANTTNLKERMIAEANEMGMSLGGKKLGIPVIWIGESDPKEATDLNLLGLLLQLEQLTKQN